MNTHTPVAVEPTPAANGRLFGLQLAAALATFEILFSLAVQAPFVPSTLATAVFVLMPLTVYGVAGYALGGYLFKGARGRLMGSMGFAAYMVIQIIFHRSSLFSGGFQPMAIALTLAAIAGGLSVARLPLPEKAWRLLSFHAWGVLVVCAWLWAGESRPVRLAPAPERPGEGPNIVLISWDTVRADVLSMYGGTGLATPTLDALAARSTVFDQALAVAPITAPSHATMLTGLYPITHGLRSNGTRNLHPSAPTFAEAASAAGYETGGFVSGYPLLARYGFDKGFQVYDDRLPNSFSSKLYEFGRKSFLWLMMLRNFADGRNKSSTTGDVVNERALAWYSATKGPAFLFMHYYDAHAPFDPAEPYRSAAEAAAATAEPKAVDAAKGQRMMTMQRGEIAYLDDLLGAVMQALEAKDPGLANTVVIVTSDHGECFGEGGHIGEHVPSLYEATQHVPLIVHFPGGRDAGVRVPDMVSHLDLVPTMADEMRLEWQDAPGFELQGGALQPWVSGPGTSPRDSIYLEAMQDSIHDDRKQAWRTLQWKWVLWATDRQQLFELAEGETRDQLAEQAAVAGDMAASMGAFLEAVPVATGTERTMTAEETNAMNELGYVGDD